MDTGCLILRYWGGSIHSTISDIGDIWSLVTVEVIKLEQNVTTENIKSRFYTQLSYNVTNHLVKAKFHLKCVLANKIKCSWIQMPLAVNS